MLVVRHEGRGTRLYEFPPDASDACGVVDFGVLALSAGTTLRVDVVDEKDAPRSSLEVTVAGSPRDRARFGPDLEQDAILDSYVAERSGVTDAAGSLDPHLTVATYARPNAFAEVQAAAKNEGTRAVELDGGGLAVYAVSSPTNIHLAYPGTAHQVEVFAPDEGLALRLVSNGKIRPVP